MNLLMAEEVPGTRRSNSLHQAQFLSCALALPGELWLKLASHGRFSLALSA